MISDSERMAIEIKKVEAIERIAHWLQVIVEISRQDRQPTQAPIKEPTGVLTATVLYQDGSRAEARVLDECGNEMKSSQQLEQGQHYFLELP